MMAQSAKSKHLQLRHNSPFSHFLYVAIEERTTDMTMMSHSLSQDATMGLLERSARPKKPQKRPKSQAPHVQEQPTAELDPASVHAQIQQGIEMALQQVPQEPDLEAQLHEVYKSKQFCERRQHFISYVETQQAESNEQMDAILKELAGLRRTIKFHKAEFKRETKDTPRIGAAIDVSEDLLSAFIKFDVQRRFFNIIALETLQENFGVGVPQSIQEFRKKQQKVPIQNLLSNGYSMTLDEFMEAKKKFNADKKERAKLLKDQESFFVYRDGDSSEGSSDSASSLSAAA